MRENHMRRSPRGGRPNNGGGHPNQGGSHSSNQGGGNGGQQRRSTHNVPNRNQVFDSNGPEIRIRGNAWQLYEKYQALARDAHVSGDRVKCENYLQHAEHYFRIMLSIQEAMGESYRRAAPEQGVDNASDPEGNAGGMDEQYPQQSQMPPQTYQPQAQQNQQHYQAQQAQPMVMNVPTDLSQMPQPSTEPLDLTQQPLSSEVSPLA